MYTEAICACVATCLDCNFSSSIVCAMANKEHYNSETELAISLKVTGYSSNVVPNVVLLISYRYHDFRDYTLQKRSVHTPKRVLLTLHVNHSSGVN